MREFDKLIYQVLCESLDATYDYNPRFKELPEKDERTGLPRLNPNQEVSFVTDDGVAYEWNAFEYTGNEYGDKYWEIIFGTPKEGGNNWNYDTSINGKGNSLRVFATVISITKDFIDFGGERVQYLTFSAKERSRISLYKRFIKRFIKGYTLKEYRENDGSDAKFVLKRI